MQGYTQYSALVYCGSWPCIGDGLAMLEGQIRKEITDFCIDCVIRESPLLGYWRDRDARELSFSEANMWARAFIECLR
jgi:hypothetical protein